MSPRRSAWYGSPMPTSCRVEPAARIAGGESACQAGQRGAARGLGEPEPERPLWLPGGRAGIIKRRAQLVVGRLPALAEPGAERGEPHTPAGPVEERAAYLALQGCDEAADPGLGQAGSLSGTAEMQLVGEGQEDLNLGQVHA